MVALIAGAPQDPLVTQFSVTPGSLGPLGRTSGWLQGRDEVTQIGYQEARRTISQQETLNQGSAVLGGGCEQTTM